MASPWLWFAVLTAVVALTGAETDSLTSLSTSSRKERFLVSVLRFHNARCVETASSGRRVEGVCQHRAECKYLRGNSMGSCAIFGTCCAIERSCNNATSLKVAYFVSPPSGGDSFCNFRVDVTNKDVCQVRLDFEEFSLAQPTKADVTTSSPYECRTDVFIIKSLLQASHELPLLCGENAGQHMYVPVNNSQGGNAIALSFMLANRVSNPSLPAARWRIKITQVECRGSSEDVVDYSSISASIQAAYKNSVWNKQLPDNTDSVLRAPPGCLQYYTARSGVYETFNYMAGQGPYIANLNYAICFRRDADVCGIRHTPDTFSLGFNSNLNQYTDEDCVGLDGVDMPSQDYLYVPEGFTNTVVASKYCGLAVNATHFITSIAPGPLSVFFRSDNLNPVFSNGVDPEKGFRINYEMLNNC